MPNSVTPSMPLKTAVPSVRRISAPAPSASTSGTTPRMNANDVIRIGRSRSRHASSVASRRGTPASLLLLGELDDQDRVLARQADQHHEADLREDVDVHARPASRRRSSTSRHIGTTRMTASGSDQLSYCAASTRKTSTTASAKTIMAVLPACSSQVGQLGPLVGHRRAAARCSASCSIDVDRLAGADARRGVAVDRRRRGTCCSASATSGPLISRTSASVPSGTIVALGRCGP